MSWGSNPPNLINPLTMPLPQSASNGLVILSNFRVDPVITSRSDQGPSWWSRSGRAWTCARWRRRPTRSSRRRTCWWSSRSGSHPSLSLPTPPMLSLLSPPSLFFISLSLSLFLSSITSSHSASCSSTCSPSSPGFSATFYQPCNGAGCWAPNAADLFVLVASWPVWPLQAPLCVRAAAWVSLDLLARSGSAQPQLSCALNHQSVTGCAEMIAW